MSAQRRHRNAAHPPSPLPYDARRLRSQFTMTVANLSSFHAFFDAAAKRLYARTAKLPAHESRSPSRGRPPVPSNALYVGTYCEPVTADLFFDDLNDALANLAIPNRTATA